MGRIQKNKLDDEREGIALSLLLSRTVCRGHGGNVMNQMFFYLEQIFRMTSIPIRVLDEQGEVFLFNCGFRADRDPVIIRN